MKNKSIIFPLGLVFYEIATYLSNDMYLPMLPQIKHDFQINNTRVQQTLAFWMLGSGCLQLLLGPLSDRYGRKPVVALSSLIFILANLGCALATHYGIFLLARFCQGCAVCAVTTAGYAAINEILSSTEAMKTIAWMNSITLLAPAMGPLLGAGVFALRDNWRDIFWMLTGWGSLAIVILMWVMPESNPSTQRKPFDFTQLMQNYIAILKNFSFIQFTLTYCSLYCALIIWIASGALLMVETFGLSTSTYAINQILVFGALIVGVSILHRLLDRFPPTKIIFGGIFIALCSSIVGLWIALWHPRYLIGFLFTLMIFSFGTGLAIAPVQRLAIDSCSEPMGTRMAVFTTFIGIFAVIASLLVSAFYQSTIFSVARLICLMASISMLIFCLKKPQTIG